MDASTQVAPMPVLHSVMMLKVSEASRATSVTRAAAAAAAATSRRNSLSLQHALLQVQAAESAAAASASAASASSSSSSGAASSAIAMAAPMTPHAVASSKPAASASSPRDPSSKVAAASPPLFGAKQPLHGFAVSPLKLHATMAPSASPASPGCSSPESSPVCKRAREGLAQGSPTGASPVPSLVVPSGSPKSASSSPKAIKANTGRWTDAEHKLFLKGLETFPYRAWKKIATLIKTRTVVQIRTHAQKYYQKLEKEEARMKDREAHQHGKDAGASSSSLSASSSSSASPMTDADELSDAASAKSSSPARKKGVLRKRKFTLEEDGGEGGEPLPSLPKRMMKEKKFPREKHMSPKQKAPVSGNKFFGASFGSPESTSSASSSSGASESAHRAVFGGRASKVPPHPLEFEDEGASAGMILDFADDKSIVEYPFHLDGSMDQSMSSMDNDDLLQLTDEESLDWFSASGSEEGEDGGASAEELLSAAAAAAEPMELSLPADADVVADVVADAGDAAALESSPLTLGRYHFSPLYTDECLQFSDASGSGSSASPSDAVELGACDDAGDFLLSDDDDFVLDPEKFLSSYFSPSASSASA